MIDTGPAKLPGLVKPKVTDQGLARWVEAVSERLEVREGSRGNPNERAVTVRELNSVAGGLRYLTSEKRDLQPGDVVIELGGGLTASVAIDQFIDSIKATRLYKDLIKRLDDPSRFNDFPEQVREALLRSIADEARVRGAAIQNLEYKFQSEFSSIALAVREVTAAVEASSAGVRELTFASATKDRAQAGKVTQLEASLGNYYLDGTDGRAILEEVLQVSADRVDGLRAQYTLKVQAGGALAGFGIAAEEVNGVPSSAFIIAANKFAIVDPATYTSGLTNSPDTTHVPFGVDSNGIYLNSAVYIRGTLRVDSGGKTIGDGLRGSLQISASGTAWSDAVARQAIWAALGNPGTASNSNHLVLGDSVTITSPTFTQTRHWFGTAWTIPGAVLSGDLLVDGSIAAAKVDTRNLTVRDGTGVVIFSSGVQLAGTYIADAAITSAKIGTAEVGTLKIAGNAVTVPVTISATSEIIGDNNFVTILTTNVVVAQAGFVFASASIRQGFLGSTGWQFQLKIAGNVVFGTSGGQPGDSVSLSGSAFVGAGTHAVELLWKGNDSFVRVYDRTLYAVSAMR